MRIFIARRLIKIKLGFILSRLLMGFNIYIGIILRIGILNLRIFLLIRIIWLKLGILGFRMLWRMGKCLRQLVEVLIMQLLKLWVNENIKVPLLIFGLVGLYSLLLLLEIYPLMMTTLLCFIREFNVIFCFIQDGAY